MKLFIGLGVMSSIVTSKPTVASRSGALIEKELNDSLLQTTTDTFEFDFFPGTTSSSITFPDEFGAWASTLPELETSAPAFPELFETTPSMTFPILSTTDSVEPIFPESTVGPTSNLAATGSPLDLFPILVTTDGLVFPPDMFTTAPDIVATADSFDYKSLENEIPDSEFLETTPLLPVELETNSVQPITTMTAKIVSPSIKATTTTTTLGNQVDTRMTSTIGSTSSTNPTSMTTSTTSNASTTTLTATTSTTSISMQSSSSISTSTLVIIPVNSTVVSDTSTLSTSTVDASTLTSTTHATTTTIEGNDTIVTVAPVVEETTAALPTETTSSSNLTDATTTITTTTKAGASATTGSVLSTLVFIILLLID